MLALALDASAHYGLAAPEIRIGDVGLFAALVAALDLAPAWKRRLVKDFNRKTNLAQDLDRLVVQAARSRPEYQGVLTALAGSDPQGRARARHRSVVDRRHLRRRRPLGGRDRRPLPGAGGARRRPRAAARDARADRALPRHRRRSGSAAADLRALAADANLALDAALDLFESRTGFLAARGVDVAAIRFSTAFGRGLDYYTGFVFELHDPRARVPAA